MISNPSAATRENPQAAREAALNAVLQRLAAPVLQLAIPDSPFAAGSAPAPEPNPAPDPAAVVRLPRKSEPPPAEAESGVAVIDVPPVIEPTVAVEPASAVDRPLPPAAPKPGAAKPLPVLQSVAIRRARPKIARPPRKAASPAGAASASAAKPARTKLSERLDRVGGGARAHHPRTAAAPAARAPSRDRPVMAPAAATVARLPRAGLAPAAVPETRPLTQNRRLYRRVMLGAELEIDGNPSRLIDLSIGGFAASGAPTLAAGAVVPVALRMTIDGIDIGTRFSARMVYANGARAAGRFVELTAAQTAFLRYIVTWRGEAIGAVGTTTLLDAITRWPERAFQPHPSTVPAASPKQGWWSRLVGHIPLLGWRRRE